MKSRDDCETCHALELIATTTRISLMALGQLRSDHEFAQHATQPTMFDEKEILSDGITTTKEIPRSH
jgi:hypothetical protein